MSVPPPPTAPEQFAALLRGLAHAVVTQGIIGRLSQPLVALIITRIREIAQRVACIAGRLRDGRFRPRRAGRRRKSAPGRPRRRNPLPQTVGWLLKLVPEAVGSRSQLEFLFRDDDMAALLAAAPAPLRRPLRALCRMLGVTPPAILAPPPATSRRRRRRPHPRPGRPRGRGPGRAATADPPPPPRACGPPVSA